MLEPFEAQTRESLEAEPALPAATVLQRLMAGHPTRFTEKHLRTAQRAVKAWRTQLARRIILDGGWMMDAAASLPAAAGSEAARSEIIGLGNTPP